MRNTSKIITDLLVDDALRQTAPFEFDADDRQYIDNQILGCQQHLVDALIKGRHATFVRLSGSSAAVTPGDTVCLASQVNATELVVTKSTGAALTNAKAGFGVVIYAGAPGTMILVAFGGALPPSMTSLASGANGYARINTTTSRLERVVSRASSDYGMGSIDAAGWVKLETYAVDALAATVLAGDAGDGNRANVTASGGVRFTGNPKAEDGDIPVNALTSDGGGQTQTLLSYATANSRVYSVRGIVSAHNVAVNAYGEWEVNAFFTRTSGGTLTMQTGAPGVTEKFNTNPGVMALVLDANSGNLRLRGTGVAGSDRRWTGRLFVHESIF